MTVMRSERPARRWKEAFPVGNGKTAVMVYGGIGRERLDFNDATLWSGYPKNHDDPAAKEALGRARKAVLDGRYAEAEGIVRRDMDGDYSEAYMPLGTVYVTVKGETGGEYGRYLDLSSGVLTVRSGKIERKIFVSEAGNAAVCSFESDAPFGISLRARTPHKGGTRRIGDLFVLQGNAPDRALPNYLRTAMFPISYREGKAAAFCLAVRAESDGRVNVTGGCMTVKGAKYVRLYMRTDTGFKGYDEMPENSADEVSRRCADSLAGEKFDIAKLEAEHKAAFSERTGRQRAEFAEVTDSTETLYARARAGKADAQTVQLLYDLGKYMIVSGSADGQPLNLQGQWNKSRRPPWSSNLTTNINFEMNYWAASACGLNESLVAFRKAAAEIAERGAKTAKTNFGMSGFCCNHNVDIWRNTSPVKGDPQYMYSPLCGAWIACEVYRHGKTSGEGYGADVVAEAARFCLDYLIEKDGRLTVAPSVSPETKFVCEGGQSAVGEGSAFELSVIAQTLAYCAESAADEDLRARAKDALARLAPLGTSAIGLAEWQGGRDSAEKGHRHFSPLFGVYPGQTVTRGSAEFSAAEKLFGYRLANSTPGIGWSAAWAMCLAGRFGDPAAAQRAFYGFTSRSVLPNFFGFHPPCYFQIDGNLGFVAGINETLVTNDDGVLTFLPALLSVLPSGRVRGLMSDGAALAFEWKDGKIVYARSERTVAARRDNIAEDAVLENIGLV